MAQEHPHNIIRSWNLQSNFATGPVRQNKLVPPKYGRTETNFITTWREEVLDSRFDWDTRNYSVLLPESLRVLTSIYIRVNLPALSGGAVYKKYPALYILKRLTILSGGQEVYSCDVGVLLADYCQSLSEEQLKVFGRTYLGNQTVMDGSARTVMVPVLLPNSSYMGRTGDNLPHGIFPAFLGSGRLEFQVTLNSADYLAAAAANVPGSISGACSLMYHQVEMDSVREKALADLRGRYSLMTRRFTELTQTWQPAAANTLINLTQYQPQGAVTELILIAVPDTGEEQGDHSRCGNNYVLPINFRITADSVVQKDLNTPEKVKAELWTNGFVAPVDFPSPGRLCFASHSRSSDHVFSGAYKMTGASTIEIDFTFAQNVVYRLVASQIQRVSLDGSGQFRGRLN